MTEAIRVLTEISLTTDSKFRIYNFPPALPNKCVACNSSHPGDEKTGQTRAFIDTGQDLEYYGVIYYCTQCFVEIANTFGYVSPEQFSRTQDLLNEMTNSVKRLWQENEALRSAISALSDHRCASTIEPDVHILLEADSVGEADTSSNAAQGNDEEPNPDEHSGSEGLPSIRRNAKSSGKSNAFAELDL